MGTWQETAAARQNGVLESIPAKWRLPDKPTASAKDVRHIPKTCGLVTPEQLSITERTTVELAAGIAQGRWTSVEVTEAFCARAAVAHQCVNCLTGFYYEEALEKAAEADTILQKTRKPLGPLHGVPIAVKDIFNVKSKSSTMGLVAWQDKEWGVDASIVTLLKAAGAIQFASTTMPQAGMMLQTVSPLWGRTLNPFNTDFVPGGSSGGDGALLAMRGSPFCPSTDIGGSIRAPAAFNGLYGIRPTADRIPKFGMISTAPGQTSIKVSCGPNCHSVGDLKLVTKLLLGHADFIGYDPTAVTIPWKDVPSKERLVLGVLKTDSVVTPQPPILRALSEVADKLKAAGHTVVELEPPIDLWEAALVTWKLYFQTGAKELRALVHSAGEPLEPTLAWYLDTFAIKELSVPELFQTNLRHAAIKRQFADFWAATEHLTGTGSPIDGLICPCAPSASFPHDFPVWWGYTSIWNLLDYPSTILPLKGFNISAEKDPKDATYAPIQTNPFDKMNAEIYDPELWAGMPVAIQIVRQQFADEELLAVTEVVDRLVNSS